MSVVADRFHSAPSPRALAKPRLSDMDFVIRLFTLEMVAVVVTQKVAVPIGGAKTSQVALALLLHAGALTLLALRGVLRVDQVSLFLWCGLTFVAGMCAIFLASPTYSTMSFLLLLIISTFYVFRVEMDRDSYLKWLRSFQWIAVGAASLVFLNWATQIAGLGIFNLQALMPERIVYLHYNYIQPIHWSSPWMKPNAIFFLETSHISQFLAMAIVIELTCFFRIKYLAFLGAALLSSFGGTGMLTLALCVPFLLGRVPKGIILAGLLALPVAYTGAKAIGLTENIENRITEFGKRGTSGEMRFSRPAEAVVDAMFGDEADLFTGKGAGEMPKGKSQLGANFAWAPYAKVFVEYGIIAFAFWAALILTSMFGHGVPFAISWVVFLQYQFMNGSLNVPVHTIYAALLAASVVVVDRKISRPSDPGIRSS
jgi:hypothetical protein